MKTKTIIGIMRDDVTSHFITRKPIWYQNIKSIVGHIKYQNAKKNKPKRYFVLIDFAQIKK